MDVQVIQQPMKDVPCDVLIVGVARPKPGRENRNVPLDANAAVVDHLLDGLLTDIGRDREFNGHLGEITTLHSMGKLAARRILLVGLGPKEGINAQSLRRASATAARHAQKTGAHSLVLALAGNESLDDSMQTVQAQVEGALLGLYRFRKYQGGEGNGNGQHVTKVQLLSEHAGTSEVEQAVRRGIVLAEATNVARDMVNEPPNVLTPTELAARAVSIAKQFGLEYEVLERPQMQELGMGGLLAVAQGSAEPPKFIILRYRGAPEQGGKGMALVGKGITFDTGGISIKPAERMHEMKGDMAGAAAVIGAMQAIALLKPALNVTALVSTAENMPSGTAYHPGDILRIMNGKTIEILNTDAEGRLVLADALSYAVNEGLSPIIDVATLTGGIVIALGAVMSGMFCNDEELAAQVLAAGRAAGEKFWPMPLDEEYAELVKSDVADVKQTGGRAASPVTAAKILEHFVGEAKWAHLDIAGTDYSDTPKAYQEKGATGFAVRTLAELAVRLGRK